MTFQFLNGVEDAYKSLSAIAKFNAGAWKSTKQRQYLMEKVLPSVDFAYPRNAQNATNYGVKMEVNQIGFVAEATIRWADYGRKSLRRVGWFFVLDDIGVVAQYKIHYTCDDKSGYSAPNPERTEEIFRRAADVVAPVAPVEEVKVTRHVGQIGQRLTDTLSEVYFLDRGPGPYGNEYFTIWKNEEGDAFYYNNFLSVPEQFLDSKKAIEVNFTVKGHIINKNGENVTVVSRMLLSKNQKVIFALKGNYS